MTDHYTIQDRVPAAVIAAITTAALRVYLERHEWERGEPWPADGRHFTTYSRNGYAVAVPEDDMPASTHMLALILNALIPADSRRSADVIAELQEIVASLACPA